MKFYNNINGNKNEIQEIVYQKLSSPPSDPVEGQYYYNTTTKKVLYYDGTQWIESSNAGEAAAIYVNTFNSTTETECNPTFVKKDSVDNIITEVNVNDGITYKTKEGTTSNEGTSVLVIGNNKSTGTDKNKTGSIEIYGSNANKTTINVTTSTSDVVATLPNESGTILIDKDINVVQITTEGTKIAEITVNGTKTDIYAPQVGEIKTMSTQETSLTCTLPDNL